MQKSENIFKKFYIILFFTILLLSLCSDKRPKNNCDGREFPRRKN